MKGTISSLEKGQTDGLFVDFKARSDGQFECITLESVTDIIDKVYPSASPKLYALHVTGSYGKQEK